MTDDMVMEKQATDCRTRAALLMVREGLLLILAAIEDYLGMPRTKGRKDRI